MKIAFLHTRNEFTSELFRELKTALNDHELVSWEAGSPAPADDIEILLSSGEVGREHLLHQPKLALIQTTSTGYETVDIDTATELGIWVSYAPSDLTGNATSVAEFAVLLILGASRSLGEILRSEGDSQIKPRTPRALNGKTVCIVGLGSIGIQIIDRLRPFGVLFLATDEHPEKAPADVVAFRAEQLHTAVADADYVVVCARASKENVNLIGAKTIKEMKRGAILINIARGTLVDEKELATALKAGHLSAVGLDVLKDEPLTLANPLMSFPQALITPHIAAFTDLMLAGTVTYVDGVIRGLSAGRLPASLLNRPAKPKHRFDSNEGSIATVKNYSQAIT
jgi:phosphoglycerate dehydrogenase-like enzyme